MKIQFIYLPLLFLGIFMKAQVGIGTNSPDANTVLDLYSTSKGLLIPRVQLTGINDTATIPVTSSASSPEQGTVVYNLSNAGTSPSNVFKDTFYIWTGTQWEGIADLTDVRTEIGIRNTTHMLFTGNSATVSTAYTPSAYSAWTNMDFSTERLDIGNIHAGGTFTIPTTGLYSFFGIVALEVSTNSGNVKSFGARIINANTSKVLATSYYGTVNGGDEGDMPLYWMGTLTAGTQIQIQYRMRDVVSSTVSTVPTSNITVRKHF
ncbi:hypothetical protein SAMN05421664_2110 [Chryseobacterium soldanellicola]|uniref:C1q domain-containing protein n=1 Tax=Chryseobacterium soldanellicola TaxID=311333 RepID=A0A1H1CU19_9FLAO|nr:hypothetical protein [Chryseobacterium soldanellicola]SDQ67408.1 hypothetical protein SAMN05421664_2110 [Chryseobacterium soldanellicola]